MQRGRPRPPVERVRSRLAKLAGSELASQLPRGYQRLGPALLLRLPPRLVPWGREIGRLFREEVRLSSVWDAGIAEGEERRRPARLLAGEAGEVLHHEEGIDWWLDPSEVLFAAGNRSERRRAGDLVKPGERVADLFAGIGYFTLPAAKFGRPKVVHAVEKNATSYGYLVRNVAANGVASRVVTHPGDNRTVELPLRSFDRIFLGLLPTSLPFVPRALDLLPLDGGFLHVHLVVSAGAWREEATRELLHALEGAGGSLVTSTARRVKPYGPARSHVVVDARVVPRPP